MIGSAVDSYRIAPQEQPPVNGIFIVSLISVFVSDLRRMKRVTQDNFPSDATINLLFSRSQEQAAVDFESLSGDPTRVVRGEESHYIADVSGTPRTSECRHGSNPLDRLHILVADRRIHVCIGDPGRNCIDGNIADTERVRQ